VAEEALRDQKHTYHQSQEGYQIHPAKPGSPLAVHWTKNGPVEAVFPEWVDGCRFLHAL
jgi:hypothetical protein